MDKLKEKLNYEMNCLVEGLDSKKQVIENIQNLIESEYISKGSLKKVLGQLTNMPKNDDISVEEAMEIYNTKGISFVCRGGKIKDTIIDTIDIPIENTTIEYIEQRRAN